MKADKNKFLSKWYIIDRCEKWFGFGVSFNMVDTIIKAYRERKLIQEKETEDEQIFEDTMIDYIAKFNEEKKERRKRNHGNL